MSALAFCLILNTLHFSFSKAFFFYFALDYFYLSILFNYFILLYDDVSMWSTLSLPLT